MSHQPLKPRVSDVVVSQPVHQHAYETAVAAQEAGLLHWFATSLYRTGRGLSHPILTRFLPSGKRKQFERLQLRRWHPDLDPAKVLTLGLHQLVPLLLRRTPLADAASSWSYEQFDKAVAKRLLRDKPRSAIHAFEGAAMFTFQAAKLLSLPTILDAPSAHEYFLAALKAEGHPESNLPGGTLRVRAERALADHILAPSPYVTRCLIENGVPANKIVQIPYGANTTMFVPSSRPRDLFRALFVGLIGLRKGVRYLFEAWRQLDLPDAELLLVGPCDKFGKTLLASQPPNCRWVGQVPRYEVDRWFGESDVFVFPSLAEGSALVTYEAMASGLPLITTENAGSVARDGQEGFIVPARDTAALADMIKKLFEDRDLRARMGSQARLLIERHYTWHHYRERLGIVYRAILNGEDPHQALSRTRVTVPSF